MKIIRKAIPHIMFTILVAIIASVLDGITSIVMMYSIDAVMEGNREAFSRDVIKLIGLAIALLPFSLFLSYGKGIFKKRTITSLKVDFISNIFKKNINEFQRDNNAKYISALTNDINTIESNYIDGVYEVIINLVNFIVAFLVIGYISPLALAFGLGIGICSTFLSVLLSKPLQKHHAKRSQLYEGYTSYIKEVLSAFHIIKSNNLINKIQEDFEKKSKGIQEKGYIIDKIHTFIMSVQNLIMSFTFLGILAVSVYLTISGNLTLGGVILIINNIEKLLHPVLQMGEWLPKIFSTKSIFNRLQETVKVHDHYKEEATIQSFNHAINFKNVSFSYEDVEVLRDVNLTLKKGDKYLVVGPSGGGKSTLLKLLRKYFTPQQGCIEIDGRNLKDIKKDSYFSLISNIEQQVFLFEDTVRNNITLYKEYTEEELTEAIEKAGLKDFINGLTNGLDSMIYDNGKNISGGEKSRLAIARSLLLKSDIIFLDEAFSSLDSKVAKEIENTLLSLHDVTVINVSHVIFEETKEKYSQVFNVNNKNIVAVQ